MAATDREKDLFVSTLVELANKAPPALVTNLNARLEHISKTNPNRAHTARSCLQGLSQSPTLMHVLTAAYLINGGVMMKEDHYSLTEDLEEFEKELCDFHLADSLGDEYRRGCEREASPPDTAPKAEAATG